MTYSSAVNVRRQRFTARGQNAVTFKTTSKRLGPVSNTIVLLAVICLLGLVYLTQVTKTNSYSYQLDQLKEQQSVLKEETKDLELSATRLRVIDEARIAGAAEELVAVTPTGAIQSN